MTAWHSILREHGAAVWRTVYRLLNHDADALDCYQETFLAAWRFAERQRVGDWGAFLTTVAVRRALNRLRSRRRSRSRVLALDGVPEPSLDGDGPLQQAAVGELLDRVREGLAELPDKQAEVFWLRYVEGLSNQQVADRLQVAPGEVRVLLHRARARLRAVLQQTRQPKGESHE
jgi:RNA polymerase sigma-70 factor (ECF subfamily)